MAEGTSTFMGLAPALLGESEIKQQTLATDILSITGAASQTGDFIVCQNSTGTELFVVSSSGLVTAKGLALSGVSTFAAGTVIDLAISSTTSTNYGISFALGASAVAKSLIKYPAGITGATTSVFEVSSSNGPSYLLSVASSAGAGLGAAVDNGFFDTSAVFLSAPSTAITYGVVKMLSGSYVYYLLAVPNTSMVVS